tara:strand:+ start:317 stop:982 length:666 start_codon:yes stop_codon:yes gene_type:complete
MFMENDFKKNKYKIIKNLISPQLASFLFTYLFMKRNVQITMVKEGLIAPFSNYFGSFKDPQVMNTYSHYADIAMETLLFLIKPKLEKIMGTSLIETYSYCRMYKNGDILKRHKDRPSCQLSATVNLGGDPWPIFVEPDETKGGDTNKGYVSANTSGVRVDLEPGDAFLYEGCKLEHWREPFEGEACGQVFLHYNSDNNQHNLYDGRPHLGLPSELKKNVIS